MIKIINEEKFVNFLKENVKSKYYDVEAYISDLFVDFESKPYNHNNYYEYELSKFESKDGLPHLIGYEVSYRFDEENEIIDYIIKF